MITEAERPIAENRTQAYHQKVLRLIEGAGERDLTKSALTRRSQFLERRQRKEILLALAESGEIESGQRRPGAPRAWSCSDPRTCATTGPARRSSMRPTGSPAGGSEAPNERAPGRAVRRAQTAGRISRDADGPGGLHSGGLTAVKA
jgi:hypothetical protein